MPPPIPDESDFASFPIPPSIAHALPHDWTVTGKKTAFWAESGVKVFDAELLGFPLRVRATPIEFLWDFGDGSGDRTADPGREPRRPADGSVTHAYGAKGERSVTLTTVYTGEYNYGDGWNPIAGTASVASDALPMTVYRFHKYRVGDDCRANPHGPDC
ncbi:PKD domain-containing protein [Brevibacterium album]|uniref:PKD domain-containing protein n=1 Tax=Brevibacterium album TaxID=417948 RepID=UPI000400564C|nr:PKD domain-containing protein [Brevibacterium album]